MVDAGFGDVSAKTRAEATASAKVLNSARGVTLPSQSIAPPITQTSLTRKNVSGSSAAARARLVRGPTATIVIVSSGFSFKSRRISWWAGRVDGIKYDDPMSFDAVISSMVAPSFGALKSVFQVSAGDR